MEGFSGSASGCIAYALFGVLEAMASCHFHF